MLVTQGSSAPLRNRTAAWYGARWYILLAFPSAWIVVSIWRFPIPFDGYQSGVEHIGSATIATFYYGTIGGFLLLGVLGALAGVTVHKALPANSGVSRRIIRIVVGLIALAGAIVLAILDKLIGQW